MVTTSTNLTAHRDRGRAGHGVSLIGIHTMEAPEAAQTAENIANYFDTVQASSHWCVDNNSRVRVVPDEDTAWTLRGANQISLNVELAGYAKQDAKDWADAYSISELEIAALCCAEWVIKFGIPVRRLTDRQIANQEKGFAGHVDVNRVLKQSTHTDPGPAFPWNYFLGRVNAQVSALRGHAPLPVPSQPSWDNKGFTTAQIAARQNQLNVLGYKLVVDGQLGPKTLAAVKDFQAKNGLVVDGLPGPLTTAKLTEVILKLKRPAPTPPRYVLRRVLKMGVSKSDDVGSLQRVLHIKDDDVFGPATKAAVIAFQRAHHLTPDGEVGPATAAALGWDFHR